MTKRPGVVVMHTSFTTNIFADAVWVPHTDFAVCTKALHASIIRCRPSTRQLQCGHEPSIIYSKLGTQSGMHDGWLVIALQLPDTGLAPGSDSTEFTVGVGLDRLQCASQRVCKCCATNCAQSSAPNPVQSTVCQFHEVIKAIPSALDSTRGAGEVRCLRVSQ
jgi:hypothetical protein